MGAGFCRKRDTEKRAGKRSQLAKCLVSAIPLLKITNLKIQNKNSRKKLCSIFASLFLSLQSNNPSDEVTMRISFLRFPPPHKLNRCPHSFNRNLSKSTPFDKVRVFHEASFDASGYDEPTARNPSSG